MRAAQLEVTCGCVQCYSAHTRSLCVYRASRSEREGEACGAAPGALVVFTPGTVAWRLPLYNAAPTLECPSEDLTFTRSCIMLFVKGFTFIHPFELKTNVVMDLINLIQLQQYLATFFFSLRNPGFEEAESHVGGLIVERVARQGVRARRAAARTQPRWPRTLEPGRARRERLPCVS